MRRPYSEVIESLERVLKADGYQVGLDRQWNVFSAWKNAGSLSYNVRATPPDGIVSTERYPIVAVGSGRPTNAVDLAFHWGREAGRRLGVP